MQYLSTKLVSRMIAKIAPGAVFSTGYEALNSALFSARLLQNLQLVLFLQYEKTTQK